MKQIRLKNGRVYITRTCLQCPCSSPVEIKKIEYRACGLLNKNNVTDFNHDNKILISQDCPLEDYQEDCENKEPPPPKPQFPESKPTQTAPPPPPADYRKPEIGIHINIKI